MSDAPKDYSELNRQYEYDEAKATLLAEAMTEAVALERRKQYLLSLMNQNKNLKRFLWQSEDGKITALHDLDPDHIVNIMNYLIENDREISNEMKAEARKRGIAVPGDMPRLIPAGGKELAW